MDNEKKIEIPFGAFDSELIHQEINIPNGFKAVIDGNKIILTRAGSEDEQIRKELTKHLKEGVEGYMPAGDSSDYRRWLDWLEKQDKSSDQIHYWTEEEIESIISDYLRGAEHYGGMIARLRCLKPKSLEKQDEQKQEINNFDVLPGLYKCVHRMFDGTPDGRLLFEVGNVYRCLSKHDRAEFEVSYGHSVYLEDPVVCKHFIPFEKQGEQKPTIEMKSAEESLGIDSETYNEIVDECIYGEQKPQRMISAEAKEAMYDKLADTVEPKYEESKTKVFDAPTPFEDKLYAFVAACEFLAIPSKIEFILEHSQEILDAAREQIGKEQSFTWSEKDEEMRLTVLQDLQNIKESYPNVNVEPEFNWLKSLKERVQPQQWKPSDEQIEILDMVLTNESMDDNIARILRELREQLKKLKGE